MRKTQSQIIALCGVLGALSVVLLMAGGLLGIGTYAAPMLASFLVIPVLEEYGPRYALLQYAGVTLLAIFLLTDRELALFYAMVLGYYPVLRLKLNAIHRAALRWAAKFVYFNAATAAMYALLLAVLAPAELVQEFSDAGRAVLAVLLVLGNLAFWLFDRALAAMTLVYRRKIRTKIKKML